MRALWFVRAQIAAVKRRDEWAGSRSDAGSQECPNGVSPPRARSMHEGLFRIAADALSIQLALQIKARPSLRSGLLYAHGSTPVCRMTSSHRSIIKRPRAR